MDRKHYTIQQLSDILGVSVAAIRKKIKADPNDENIRRYKKRYPVVIGTLDDRSVMQICLSDIELEEEKRLSGINKIKHSAETTLSETYSSNVVETVELSNDDVIDAEYVKTPESPTNLILTLTERYNNELKTYIERTIAAEKQQALLEDKEKREGLYLQEIKDAKKETAEAKELTANVIKYGSITLVTMLLLLLCSVGFLIYKLLNPTIVEKQVVVEKPVIQYVHAQPAKKTGRH